MTDRVNALDALAVIRAPLEQYPPSFNQVALLAEAGLRVGVLETSHPDFVSRNFKGPGCVERSQVGRHTLLHKESAPNWGSRICRVFKFAAAVRRTVRQRKPRVVIAYDPAAMHPAGSLWKLNAGPRLIWHFHELFERAPHAGLLTNLAVQFSNRNARKVTLVTFSDAERARLFAQKAGLDSVPKVIRNCPRRLDSLPQNQLKEHLRELGFKDARTVYFQGWMGPSRCLEVLIHSMRFWPKGSVFVLAGPISETYKESLLKLAERLGVRRRLVFMGHIPYERMFSLAVGATIGVSLVANEKDLNWKYSAGAINKRFEYMAVGLPQIANTGPGMHAIVEKPDCGLLVDAASLEETGRAIARLIEDKALRLRMADNARKAHLREFNYEIQFAPVLERIVAWSHDSC